MVAKAKAKDGRTALFSWMSNAGHGRHPHYPGDLEGPSQYRDGHLHRFCRLFPGKRYRMNSENGPAALPAQTVRFNGRAPDRPRIDPEMGIEPGKHAHVHELESIVAERTKE